MTFMLGIWFVCIRVLYMGLAEVFKKMNERNWAIPDIITTCIFYLGICLMIYPLILALPLIFALPLGITLSIMLVLFMADDIKDFLKRIRKED